MAHDITLYTADTMNGWKPLIFPHEADVPYNLVPIDFGIGEIEAAACLNAARFKTQ